MKIPELVAVVLSLSSVLIHCVASLTDPDDCTTLRLIIPECSCDHAVSTTGVVINCRYRGFKSLPDINGSFTGLISELSLSGNLLEHIPPHAFQGLNIETLDLTDNNLKSISDQAFNGLEDSLLILKISGVTSMDTLAPFSALKNLTNLQELELSYFKAPDRNLEDGDYFQPFSSLQSLVIDHWDVVSFGNRVFRGLTNLTKIQLSHLPSIVVFPIRAFMSFMDTIKSIQMSNTGIRELYQYSFSQFPKLQALYLHGNSLRVIEENAFVGIEHTLKIIDLSFNTISRSELAELSCLHALEILKLQKIGLSGSLEQQQFLDNKQSLKRLDISRNFLIDIKNNVFENLTSLANLDLSYNKISTMGNHSLQGLVSLNRLYLNHQHLKGRSLTLPSFSQLFSLTDLNLWSTLLSENSWERISKLNSLTTLSMQATGITSIPDFALRTMPNLTNINFDDNNISTINEAMFRGQNHLKRISLKNNKIHYFGSCTFSNHYPIILNLADNNLDCDCSLHWMKSAVRSGQVILSGLEKCGYPQNTIHTLFADMEQSNFCVSPQAPRACDNHRQTQSTATTTPPTTRPSVDITLLFLSSTSTSITITWRLNQCSFVSHVKVTYARSTIGTVINSFQLDVKVPLYQVNALVPNTRYEICVEAYTSNGFLLGEQCINYRTSSSDINAAPVRQTANNDLTVSVRSSNDAVVSWRFGDIQSIQNFVVIFTEVNLKDQKPSMSRKLSKFTSTFWLTRLLPNTEYEICLIAFKVGGTTEGTCVNRRTRSLIIGK